MTTPLLEPATSATNFVATRGQIFWLALRTSLLTTLTLGIYRFWMKTRLRRTYWSAVTPDGQPLEYTGDPIEKLLGFLMAVVILAFYIGIVNLLLMFVAFSVFNGNVFGYAVSAIGIIPIYFYAKYRARRYTLARTRWQGLRLGLEPGAWGYAGRALMYGLFAILSCGLLLPLMTFRLESYITNRTSFGTERMQQGGKWTMLYPAMIPAFAALFITAGAVAAGYNREISGAVVFGVLAAVAWGYAIVHYRVTTLNLLTQHKSLGGVTANMTANPARIFMIYGVGSILLFVILIGLFALLGVLLVALVGDLTMLQTGRMTDLSMFRDPVFLIGTAGSYLLIFAIMASLVHALILVPRTRHYATRFKLAGLEHLRDIKQRPRDEALQAEGFAEALDIGASI